MPDSDAIPELVAIPISAVKPPWHYHIGTGFLGARSGRLGLYTAAHVPVGRQPHRTPDWNGWPWSMQAWSAPEVRLDVQLLVPTIPMREVFSWRLNTGSATHMADMLAVHGERHGEVLDLLSKTYTPVDLDSELVLQPGDEVVGFGYPDIGGDAKWPYAPASTSSGRFLGATESVFLLDMPLDDGFSGGPVFTLAGEFAGMTIGTDPNGAAVVVRPAQLQSL